MVKHLIVCPCGHEFYSRKPLMSKSDVDKKRVGLNKKLQDDKIFLEQLQKERSDLEGLIGKTSSLIRRTEIDIREAETILQCSNCNARIPALQYEVKVK